jgi:hypothetical protein
VEEDGAEVARRPPVPVDMDTPDGAMRQQAYQANYIPGLTLAGQINEDTRFNVTVIAAFRDKNSHSWWLDTQGKSSSYLSRWFTDLVGSPGYVGGPITSGNHVATTERHVNRACFVGGDLIGPMWTTLTLSAYIHGRQISILWGRLMKLLPAAQSNKTILAIMNYVGAQDMPILVAVRRGDTNKTDLATPEAYAIQWEWTCLITAFNILLHATVDATPSGARRYANHIGGRVSYFGYSAD